MSNLIGNSGIRRIRNYSGNERKKRLEKQAKIRGITSEEMLQDRKQSILNWQLQREALLEIRCSNCGHVGHNFEWCPFALPYFLRQLDRFRGFNGSWNSNEPPLCLDKSEKIKYNKHFAILSMKLGPDMKKKLMPSHDETKSMSISQEKLESSTRFDTNN